MGVVSHMGGIETNLTQFKREKHEHKKKIEDLEEKPENTILTNWVNKAKIKLHHEQIKQKYIFLEGTRVIKP